MLTIEVLLSESYNEETDEFFASKSFTLHLEHSLVSLSKWEQKYEKPFLSSEPKTDLEALDYIKAMTLNDDAPDVVYSSLTNDDLSRINEYINSKMTATWFREVSHKPRSREIITSEIIYYWMLSLGVDKEFETWHLSRLITLIRVINEKNAPPKKMSRAEMLKQRERINQQRQNQLREGV